MNPNPMQLAYALATHTRERAAHAARQKILHDAAKKRRAKRKNGGHK